MSAMCPVSMLPGSGNGGNAAAFVIAALVVLAIYAKSKPQASQPKQDNKPGY